MTMDQDTVVPHNLVKTYLRYATDESVGILSPVIWNACVDSFTEVARKFVKCEQCTEIRSCFSSGAMHRVSALWESGGYDEALFIDYVDDDCCRRFRQRGYHILRINSLIARHYWGNSTSRKILGVKLVSPNYPPIRYYYIFRNRIYYERKYGGSYIFLLAFMLYKGSMLLLEGQRKEKLRMAAEGILDGVKLSTGKYGEKIL